ncbi:hypothetical protein OIDMADRAFT_20962 [Oidiodendron maius Zn]|uniref:Uncharacterized protein n=1 Tax=Oidiodendron maius (strain Zn) TaxID=913774 RepID=A0A0C3GY41_OIDMZ|nr:hypothetical protein OIDMADRAFT_20962 [Oidiodendron maius Zn]
MRDKNNVFRLKSTPHGGGIKGNGEYKLMEMDKTSLMQSDSSSRKSGPFSAQLPPI